MSPSASKPAGFTLVELLVVIAIIGVLVALLLPAVQSAREAARRSECQNKLKQLALGMHNHHDTFRVLPAGATFRGGDVMPNTLGYAWAIPLLPFIEQAPLYDQYRSVIDDVDLFACCNWPVQARNTIIPAFICPSQPTSADFIKAGDAATGRGMAGNYLACGGNGLTASESVAGTITDGHGGLDRTNGIFQANKGKGFQDIVDGTSNTLMLAEALVNDDDGDHRGRYYNAHGGDCLFTTQERPNSTVGDRIQLGCRPGTTEFWQQLTPCSPVGGGTETMISARSLHPGGVNAALADGSVRFIPETLDVLTYSALGTAMGGETVGSF
ncbi:MAG: DUF1559 domain-containing protein [Pirellulaceae bacterium]